MRRAIRASIFAAVAMAFVAVPTAGFAQEEQESEAAAAAAKAPKAEVPCKVSDPCVDVNGAASPEPPQEIESEVHNRAHQEWVDSIWTGP